MKLNCWVWALSLCLGLTAPVWADGSLPAQDAAGDAGSVYVVQNVKSDIKKAAAPAEAKPGDANKAAPKFPVCGIKMGKGVVRTGDDMQVVFSVFGPPDQVLPMRSKNKDENSDYIHFIYRNRFLVNINKQNMVQSMTALTNNIELDGIPFKIGQSTKDVVAKWKEPDREANDMLIYFYRGVYFITEKDAPEKIDRIYMTNPGVLEEEKSNNKAS